ncbi:MAG: cell division protein FtsZ [Clostridium sp.]|nr:cell division protein FtsZ [Clostridium sp.]
MNDNNISSYDGGEVRINPSLNVERIANQFAESPNDTVEEQKAIIKVIGVGGGGNNAVNHMYRQGIENVSFVVLNTDRQALKNSPVPTKVQIGNGLGAGNIPEKARKAAEENIVKIESLFDDDTKMVFITAGMGGGTGTGASPVVARVARERGILTIGIVTIPFGFEGEKKIIKAYGGADELSKYVDALLVINNQRLTEIYGDLDFLNAFGKADDTLSTAARSISELINDDGYMNVDFEDVDTTLRNGGAAIISCGYGEGESRVTKAIEDALNSPLLRNRDVFGSKKLLFHIFFSRNANKKFLMSEVDELTNFVSSISSDVDVIWGLGFDDELGDRVKITILAAGFDASVSIDRNLSPNPGAFAGGHKTSPAAAADKQPSAPKKKEPDHTPVPDDVRQRLHDDYGTDLFEGMGTRYAVLQPDQLDDDSVIDKIEHNPTYNRDKRTVDEINRQADQRTTPKPAAPKPSDGDLGNGKIDFMSSGR